MSAWITVVTNAVVMVLRLHLGRALTRRVESDAMRIERTHNQLRA